MSVSVRLLVSNRFSTQDLVTVLFHHVKAGKIKVRSADDINANDYKVITFVFEGETRQMNVHTDHQSPLGNCTLCSMGSNTNGIRILKEIASVLGGFLNNCDYNSSYELYEGYFNDDDGIPYFFKSAILEKKMTTSLSDLKKYIKGWGERISRKDIEKYF